MSHRHVTTYAVFGWEVFTVTRDQIDLGETSNPAEHFGFHHTGSQAELSPDYPEVYA